MRHHALLAAGGVTEWSPSLLNPALWLDASDAATITSSGGAVSAWSNKGSLGGSFAQSNAGAKPTTGTRTQNDLNVIDFDGGDSLVSSLAASAWTFLHDGTNHMVAWVAKRDVAGTNATLFTTATGAGQGGCVHTRWLSSVFENLIVLVMQDQIAMGTSTSTRLMTALYDPDNATAGQRALSNLDGDSQVAANGQSASPSTSAPPATMWLGSRSGSLQLDGTINEIVIVSGANATEPNRALIHAYLNTKWAIY